MRDFRMYQGPTGTWRYSFIRDGERYWSSLDTKDEKKAREKFNRLAFNVVDDGCVFTDLDIPFSFPYLARDVLPNDYGKKLCPQCGALR